jgi:hypothetical protein
VKYQRKDRYFAILLSNPFDPTILVLGPEFTKLFMAAVPSA